MTEILIRGMDMPKNGSTVSLRIFADGKVLVSGAPSGKAIKLPPHGRLIDADALSRDFPIRRDRYDRDHGDEHFINGIETVIEYVEYMPTILEANEAE